MSFGYNTLKGFYQARFKNISHKNFLLILSVVVGIITGLASVLIKNLTHGIEIFGKNHFFVNHAEFYFIFPIIGLLITYWVKRYVIRQDISHGIPSTLLAISKKKGVMKRFQMFGSMLTAPFTVGFGGSAGLEGPVVVTGSAMGSNLARWFRLNSKERTLFISCGAAGSIACIFNAPIASIVFAIEIFSLDLTLSSLIPLLISSISATLVYYLFLDAETSAFLITLTEGFKLSETHLYLIFGLFTALLSIYFSVIYNRFDAFFSKIKNHYIRILIGGLSLSLLLYLIPPLYGEGFSLIKDMLHGVKENVISDFLAPSYITNTYHFILLLVGILIFKPIASCVTFGAGGVGGIFAPTLFLGAVGGYTFALFLNHTLSLDVNPTHFALVGMSGTISGVLQGPLTGIFLIAELTSGYGLFTPLMIVSLVSYLISKKVLKHSVYTSELAKKGQLMTHNKDKSILKSLEVCQVAEHNFVTAKPEMTLGELLRQVVAVSKRNIFPVVDTDEALLGIITLDDIRDIMFNTDMYETVYVREILRQPPEVIFADQENMETVIKKFKSSGAWNLPVVKEGKYHGFISKSKLFGIYRQKLLEVSQF